MVRGIVSWHYVSERIIADGNVGRFMYDSEFANYVHLYMYIVFPGHFRIFSTTIRHLMQIELDVNSRRKLYCPQIPWI